MNKINYKISSTFCSVLLTGLSMITTPSLSQPRLANQSGKRTSSDLYQVNQISSTYSYCRSVITGEYFHSTDGLIRIAPEVRKFLLASLISSDSFYDLLSELHLTYGNVPMEISLYSDPEEGWVKTVIAVHSGIEDFDKLSDIEESFFARITNNSTMLSILNHIVVSQT